MTDTKNTSTQDVITSFKRIYQPKSSFDFVSSKEKPPPLPKGPWQWIPALLSKPPSFVIQYAGVDGYLFLRYLFIMSCCAFGGLLTLIILLPVNATNGKGETGLDQLGISNVGSVGRYYAHVFVSYIYYGCVMFVIHRELYFYSNLKNVIMSTPAYAKKLSSRTVIFQTASDQYLDEQEFFKLFDGVKRVWVERGQRSLAKKVEKRDKLAMKLEGALVSLLSKAFKAKLKADKKGETIEPENEIVCYVPQKKRPTMKLKPIFGKKVDVIEYCREELPKLNSEIEEMQSEYRSVKPMNSIAVEFENQYYAQLAYQARIHDQPFLFTPNHIGVNPSDIFWPNMRLFWWERLFRKTGAGFAIVALVILWAVPVFFVGVVSNLTYLTNKLHWLRFIYKLPTVLLGLVTSLLPTVMLAILMLLLPIFIRSMAKMAGAPSLQAVEYFTQQAYFAFQVIQVFLVTTISSSIASTVTQIIEDPTSAMSLLSSNIPKSSNFYVSYLVLQGFSISGGALFQVANLILFYVLSTLLDKTPRKKWRRFTSLGSYSWGTFFPVYTNLAVIFLTYAIIAPIMMLFAFAGFFCLYVAYLHNTIYVSGKGPDSVGKHYPRALFQTMTGIYLGEVCLLGLFAVSKSWGCIVLEAILIGITIFFHKTMNLAFDDLLSVVPNTVMRPLDGKTETLSWKPSSATSIFDNKYKRVTSIDSRSPFFSQDELELRDFEKKFNNDPYRTRKTPRDLAKVPLLVDGADYSSSKAPNNFFFKFLQPTSYLSFRPLKEYIPDTFYDSPNESPEWVEHAYDYPDVTAKCPILWIPKDPMGLSSIEIENLKDVIHISDEGAFFDNSGKINYAGSPPSYDTFFEKKEIVFDDE
ncbi:hypothetical protein CANARDRAFT_199240 [[Candida] arabinofermentans NRRL YB-2248]|uniref:CSC1/OSCA1-like 7TM region domain-containing protein n=1 Tax=[Candida] arabinofermentans NRRL YB-2248 TaxID=983967 RepID=A0A1E4T008_9ASCO|nr:hypothetical protein CANARDRAFT_199240 [[Candida] arabinofermentans NRRL YB-2248]